MPKKTEPVLDLVQEVLHKCFSEPYGEDIIRDVSFEIEKNLNWRRRYDELVEALGRDEVNQAIGRHVKAITGYHTMHVVAVKPHILGYYSKLRK